MNLDQLTIVQNECTRLLQEKRELDGRRKRMADALIKYGQHETLCDAVLTKELILPCSCGFAAALKEAQRQ